MRVEMPFAQHNTLSYCCDNPEVLAIVADITDTSRDTSIHSPISVLTYFHLDMVWGGGGALADADGSINVDITIHRVCGNGLADGNGLRNIRFYHRNNTTAPTVPRV
ncbi:hypothetical protein QCA50_013546 [Cerrena zonata]|uniref:Uncharacterized protein n=1 Tax=Cerrena zonata TaxID=2478898 RepID=A0AAW0FW25_9APHY